MNRLGAEPDYSGISKPEDINKILKFLFSKYSNVNENFIELRFIGNGRKPHWEFYKIPFDDRNFPYDKITTMNNQGYNVYFGVNPRPPSKQKTQKDIQDITCLWMDIDYKNYQDDKKELRKSIDEFPLTPNLTVDSGNGFHCYWILEKSIINRTTEETKDVKQILSGLAKILKADRQTFNIDRVMRLPGTLNVKNLNNPKECSVIRIQKDRFYSLSDFSSYRDKRYSEKKTTNIDLNFGSKRNLISKNNAQDALKNVKNLKISSWAKRMIITGAQNKQGADNTRSGRDQSIITSLIIADYDYPTIKSIFFNPYLKCSDRMRKKGEKQLKYEVSTAVQYLSKSNKRLPKHIQAIRNIQSSDMKYYQKIQAIADFISKDLFNDRENVSFRNDSLKSFYYFQKESKQLMDIDSIDFHCFLKDRCGLLEKDFPEILAAIRTDIWKKGAKVEVHNFAYFNRNEFMLYISDHNNLISDNYTTRNLLPHE